MSAPCSAGAIRQVVPPAGDQDADEEHCPYVEFAAEDLPWRYGLTDGGDPRPWCVLVVGGPADVELLQDRALIGPIAQDQHRLADVRRWAHVQRRRGRASRLRLLPRPQPGETRAKITTTSPRWSSRGATAQRPGPERIQ